MPITRRIAIAATATMTVSLVSAPYARKKAASTGRRARTASSPASRRAAASGSAVSRLRLVMRPKYPGTSKPASACRPPSRANRAPSQPSAPMAAMLTATSMTGTSECWPAETSQVSAG
jgi:hypothetical protein